jgi:DNA-binding NarL/FixJ family response regulator
MTSDLNGDDGRVSTSFDQMVVIDGDSATPLPLTSREQEIFALMKKGWCNKEIAKRLQIQAQTVRNHAHTIFMKLGIKRRAEAMRMVANSTV